MSDEVTNEPTAQTEPIPAPTENPISESNPVPESSQEPMPDAPIPPVDSVPSEVPSEPPQASPNPESAVMDKNQNPANEPLEQPLESTQDKPVEPETTAQNNEQIPETPISQANPNITIEKHGADTTITEVMQPPAPTAPEPPTAQMAGNEPLTETQDDQVKKRKENLKLANEKRQSKRREKINDILNLFSENKEITNDEVEKLLHVSDATATRYLESLEKEGKIKQVGKTGKGVSYTKI